MIPEPDLPVPPDDFVGRKHEIDAFLQALQQGLSEAELVRSPFWVTRASEDAACC